MTIIKNMYHELKSAHNLIRGAYRERWSRVACPICGNTHQKLCHYSLFHYYMRCPACGLIYVGDPPPLSEALNYYQTEGYLDSRRRFYRNHEDDGARRTWLDFKISTFAHLGVQIEPSGLDIRLLEIGCSEGWLMELFAGKQWQVVGIEVNSDLSEVLKRQRYEIFNGALEDFPEEGSKFQRILLFHVLEHLLDPVSAVAKIYRLCEPGGEVILETPNSVNYESIDHLFFFNEQNLKMLLERSGFKVIAQFEYQDAWHPEFRNLAVSCVKD